MGTRIMKIRQASASAAPIAAEVHETPFYIPAVDAPSRPRRTLKHDDTFAVFDSHGDIGASTGGPDGLFDCDTRHLSHLELLVAGSKPLLLDSAINDDNISFNVDLTNPDIYENGRLALQKDTLHISRTIYLHAGYMRERIGLVNYGAANLSIALTLTFASDFADIFEVRGIRRSVRGQVSVDVLDPANVRLSYRGLDHRVRETNLCFEPGPTSLQNSVATYAISLAPHENTAIFISIASRSRAFDSTASFFRGLIRIKRDHKQTTAGIATVTTGNSSINEILGRALDDLYMLLTATPDGPYPYAGIPWYSTTFGRDGIITAMQMLWLDPSIAAGVLRRLARLQAHRADASADASVGKIVHELRQGEMALLNEVPFRQYYGTVDATPLFVMLAGQYARRTGDWALIQQIWPAIDLAIAWLETAGDADGDGLIEYERAEQTGLANQGWKDSHDSVFHADGSLAEGPIALVEVQGYAYAARLEAAMCAERLGFDRRSADLLHQAKSLKALFEKRFWCDEIGFYALALDGHKRPCKVRTSNPGHALWSGIMSDERAAHVASTLMGGDFFSGWGVRTVARGEARYNPMSYHNGSIWPHDNAILAQGLARANAKRGVVDIFDALMRATTYIEHRRIPELFCGFRRRRGRGPTLYPAACSPQAWAAGAPFSLIQSLLGLELRPHDREIRLNNPVVPEIVGEFTIRGLRVGSAVADFVVRSNSGKGAAVDVLRLDGDLRISVVAGSRANGS